MLDEYIALREHCTRACFDGYTNVNSIVLLNYKQTLLVIYG